ncbi:hypothetical protein BpHYR1_034515 [Brachionus plicatilis]|uniref:Uncharacterized protein n=1 Tax=Brachionus plicatilis TaxID=10195 RepID=A0A3M7RPJ6_BRAPC|nr:hypothetical protein BpHYR1_034515 [Brachionus plicatilis]
MLLKIRENGGAIRSSRNILDCTVTSVGSIRFGRLGWPGGLVWLVKSLVSGMALCISTGASLVLLSQKQVQTLV